MNIIVRAFKYEKTSKNERTIKIYFPSNEQRKSNIPYSAAGDVIFLIRSLDF